VPTAPKIYDRHRWDARSSRGVTAQRPPATSTLFVHHSDFLGSKIDTLDEQVAAMKSMQDYHMDSNGWSDIGYSFVVFQPQGGVHQARLFEGRGPHAVPAAQLGHNTGNLAVCVVGNFDVEGVKAGTVDLLARIALWLPGNRIAGHQDVNETDCPGKHLYALIDEIGRRSHRKHAH
jgi:N-acetylmuramoyl-L-alanine amidase